MSDTKHTPGPWVVKQDRWPDKPGQLPWRVESNTVENGEQAGVGRAQTVGYAYRLHDAKLWASAPELLAALRAVFPFAASPRLESLALGGPGSGRITRTEAIEAARAAMAKAERRTL